MLAFTVAYYEAMLKLVMDGFSSTFGSHNSLEQALISSNIHRLLSRKLFTYVVCLFVYFFIIIIIIFFFGWKGRCHV